MGELPKPVSTGLTPGLAARTTALPAQTSVPTPVPQLERVLTAAQIVIVSWSPEGQWLAALVSTLEDVRSDFDGYSPPATLFFIEAATGRLCPRAELGRFVGNADPVSWRSGERVAVVIRDQVYEGRPCQTEPFALVKSDSEDARTPIASAVAAVEIETRLVSLENGIGAIETRLLADDGRFLATVAWRAAERIGGVGLEGAWLDDQHYLLPETLDHGPLIVNVDGSVTPVVDLPGIQRPVGGSPAGGLLARPFRDGPSGYAVLVFEADNPDPFGRAQLYHSATGVVEDLPYASPVELPSTCNPDWLVMAETVSLNGRERRSIHVRAVAEQGGAWRQILTAVSYVQWDEACQSMMAVAGSTIRWVTFPNTDLIGEWTMSPYEAMPGLPSPDGRAWAMVGLNSRRQEAVLVIVRRP
jgi:hypothetical protein